MPTLILASTSPYRRALLERLGLPFTVVKPDCDEDAAKQRILDPLALAEHLAEAKARSVSRYHPQAVVIGSDQVATMAGTILGKPGEAVRAAQQLTQLAGRTHELITALAVTQGDHLQRHTDRTRLTMRPLSEAEIARYLAHDRPFDCAGAYKLECQGIALFDQITSADHTAITGLPLLALSRILRTYEFEVP